MYEPPRDGPTVWEIGVPDRSAAEFYVPDPNPALMNQLYNVHPDRLANTAFFSPQYSHDHEQCSDKHCLKLHRFRQYGLWDRYTDLYPDEDLVYSVETSVYQTDWYFAHVNR